MSAYTARGLIRRGTGLWLAQPLNTVGVTLDQVTTARLVFGLTAALALAAGPTAFAAGATLLLFGVVLSRCSDSLPRLPERSDPQSERYAFFSDIFANALAFVGLGVGLRLGELGAHTITMGLLAAIAVVFVPLLARRLELIDGRRSPEFDGFAGIDADDVVFLVPIALWLGWAEGLLIIAAFGGIAFAGALYMTHYRKFTSG